MRVLRTWFGEHRNLTIMLVALALAMKALVPGGYMLKADALVLTVEICSDSSTGHLTKQIVIPTDGKSHGGQADHPKADGTCPFSSLAMGAVSGADTMLLLVALAFILLLGFLPLAPSLRDRSSYLRPPLRGPPALV